MMGSGPIPEGYREELAAGAGCCSGMNDWRRNVIPRREVDQHVDKKLFLTIEMQVFIRAMASQFMSNDAFWLILHKFKAEMIRRGWTDEEAERYGRLMTNAYRQNKSKSTEEFMG
jgi:hypothetical protein